MWDISRTDSASAGRLYQIKITLKWSKPPIWRRVQVRADMPLVRFHAVIQLAMGWTNSHLHQFVLGQVFYGRPDPEMPHTRNEKRYSLSDLAPTAKSKFLYEYDFGDGWVHETVVEEVLPPVSAFRHPVCLGGARACPPEDCGGLHGYYDLIKTLADPKNPQREKTLDWLGEEWDAECFDLAEVNAALKRLKA